MIGSIFRFRFCFRLRQCSFHWTLSDGVVNRIGRKWNVLIFSTSSNSDSDSVPRKKQPPNTERSYITRLRCSACQSQSQRKANAPIWLAYSLKSNFIKLPQDSVFLPVFCGWEINLKTKIRKKYKQAAKVIYFIYGNTCCFQFLCSEYGTVWGITQCCSICILFAPS